MLGVNPQEINPSATGLGGDACGGRAQHAAEDELAGANAGAERIRICRCVHQAIVPASRRDGSRTVAQHDTRFSDAASVPSIFLSSVAMSARRPALLKALSVSKDRERVLRTARDARGIGMMQEPRWAGILVVEALAATIICAESA